MPFRSLLTALAACFLASGAAAQKTSLIIPQDVRLPKDTVLKNELLTALSGFLLQVADSNKNNVYVLDTDLPETAALLDEMKDMERNETLRGSLFYKAYLSNATALSDSCFLIQLTYAGIKDNNVALRAVFTFFAKKRDGHFYCCAPLKENTKAWEHITINNNTVYYKAAINEASARNYFNTIAAYDKKLGAAAKPADFYCADNFHEALQLLGIDYKSDYNGYRYNTLTSMEHNRDVSINGYLTAEFKKFDTHDLWHERLHRVVPIKLINRPVDEGTAYLYGNGSWGIAWPDVLKQFKAYAAAHPDADWLNLYNQSAVFNNDKNAPLNVDYMINALIVGMIEKEKGFPAVVALLTCGRKEKDNNNYFEALQKITGIDKAHFNEKVRELVRAN